MGAGIQNNGVISKVDLDLLEHLHRKISWLSAWTIHHANHLRESRDGLKVGGHQASSASMAAIMTALYCHSLRPEDRVAVKPHASPVYHAIQYLLGRQSLEQLQNFRALGGAQSYPSRTKDKDDVDFSTGSVGLGVAVTAFASLVQDHLIDRGFLAPEKAGRMIALMGDAELDEGNIYEALIEGYKHDLRHCWWIIDYNRQSLDAVSQDRMGTHFAGIFKQFGWQVVTLKYGKKLEAAFKKPGGQALYRWCETCPNDLYSALSFKGGAAWRAQLLADIGAEKDVDALLKGYSDEALATLMTNLGGHDLALLCEAFAAARLEENPVCFICYTIKGYGLPFQGHKDNHAGLMNPTQITALKAAMNIKDGQEWAPFAGIEAIGAALEAYLKQIPFMQSAAPRCHQAPLLPVPVIEVPAGEQQSTQVAFGKILNELGRLDSPLSDHLMTTSPDVTVSTNLGGFVNQRGLYKRLAKRDRFKAEKIMSPQIWEAHPKGQHLELGIAENNLFLALAAMGLSASLFGTRLLPIGTLYDPFINRGLDALNYACYQDARFLLVATPSGVTLAPEGGAHQSIHTPLIGMAQPGLSYFEPAYADELTAIMRWSFAHMQAPTGGSVYLRLSTRSLSQPKRDLSLIEDDIIKGAYWAVAPAPDSGFALIFTGAVAPEAFAAFQEILEDIPEAGLLVVTSPDRLYRDWQNALREGDESHQGQKRISHIENLLAPLANGAGLVSLIDGAPQALSWIGSVKGHRLRPLGVQDFGQSGDVPDLYRIMQLDKEAIVKAAASLYTRP